MCSTVVFRFRAQLGIAAADPWAMRMRVLGTILFSATALSVAGTAVPAQAAEGPVFGAGAVGAVPGRYIITSNGAGVRTATMTAKQARRLAAERGVVVEQDRIMHLEGYTQHNPGWGLDRIDQRVASPLSKTYMPMDDGSAVHAYVIDTGIRITHTEFAGRASYGYDFADGDSTASDCNGHGTHVAGTIGGATYGVAKKVKLVAVRVLDCDGSGYLSDVVAGVDWVTKHAVKPAVANMSLGGGRSASVEAAVARSIKAGITYAVAAGNENANATTSSPAAVASAITVGATDSGDRRASFSNYGTILDLFAPGVDIRSSVASSDTATALYSGTSMASPHVAGAAALVLDASPTFTPAQVAGYLIGRATLNRVADRKGSPNRLLFIPGPIAAPIISASTLTMAEGKAFAQRLTTSPSRTGAWRLTAGKLPTGVTFSSAGLVSGTPTVLGSATVQVAFTDYVPNTATRTLTVTVKHTAPEITTTSLSEMVADQYNSAELTVADHRSGDWAVTGGELPDGLSLTGGDQAGTAVIEGTPTAAGDFTFTITFTDEWGGTASREYTLTVA